MTTPSPEKLELKVHQLDNDMQAIYEMISRVEGVLRRHTNRFDELNTRLDGFNTGLDGVNARLDGFDTRLDGFDTRLDRLESKTDGLDGKLDEVLRRLGP